MNIVTVKFKVTSENTQKAVDFFQRDVLDVLAMNGAKEYEIFIDPSNDGHLIILQVWESANAFKAYHESDLRAALVDNLKGLMIAPPNTSVYSAEIVE